MMLIDSGVLFGPPRVCDTNSLT